MGRLALHSARPLVVPTAQTGAQREKKIEFVVLTIFDENASRRGEEHAQTC
jgi:hypothetical protein